MTAHAPERTTEGVGNMQKGGTAPSLERLTLERDLRARSQVARFGMLHSSGVSVQTRLFAIPEPAPVSSAPNCNHVGTGRESQARFFGSGFDTICAACGQVTEG